MAYAGVHNIDTITDLYENGELIMVQTPVKSPSLYTNDRVGYWRGDITNLQVGAITNTAQQSLKAGGGICGAIFKNAGHKELTKLCREAGGHCDTGDAVVTDAPGDLQSNVIIHAVGPNCNVPEQAERREELLRSTYRRALQLAADHADTEGKIEDKTVALCSISTGIYGYPLDAAVEIALDEVRTFLDDKRNEWRLYRVIFCIFDDQTHEAYVNAIPRFFPPPSPPSGRPRKDEISPITPAVHEGTRKTGGKNKGKDRPKGASTGEGQGQDEGRDEQKGRAKARRKGQRRDPLKELDMGEIEDEGREGHNTKDMGKGKSKGNSKGKEKGKGKDQGDNQVNDPDEGQEDEQAETNKFDLEKMFPWTLDIVRPRVWAGESIRDGGGRKRELELTIEEREKLHKTRRISKYPGRSRPGRRIEKE